MKTKDGMEFEPGMKLWIVDMRSMQLGYFDTTGAELAMTMGNKTYYKLPKRYTPICIEEHFASPEEAVKDMIDSLKKKLALAQELL